MYKYKPLPFVCNEGNWLVVCNDKMIAIFRTIILTNELQDQFNWPLPEKTGQAVANEEDHKE